MGKDHPKLVLLPRDELITTGPLDRGAWSYRGLLGWVIRQRMRLVTELLAGTGTHATTLTTGRLLEVGYGSGLFLPTLARSATALSGVDLHDQPAAVEAVLARHGVSARLTTGSVTALPYPDAGFDTVVCLSVLEFVDDLDTACRELRRVLAPRGRLVVVTPGHSPVLDLGVRILTGERAEDTFQGRRQRVTPTLTGHFTLIRAASAPRFAPRSARLYTALLLE